MSDYSSENIREIYERHFVTVYRVCFMYLRNVHDTEDAVHNTFMKLIEKQKRFESTEHEKAWLIRVSQNVCKNMLRANSRRRESPTGDIAVNDNSAVSDVMINCRLFPMSLRYPFICSIATAITVKKSAVCFISAHRRCVHGCRKLESG